MKINYALEAIFLRDVVETLQQMKLAHDQKCDHVSAAINMVFNGPWSKKNADIQRGAIIGVLKTSETAMNETYVKVAKLELLVKGRVSELYQCCNAEDEAARKKKGRRNK